MFRMHRLMMSFPSIGFFIIYLAPLSTSVPFFSISSRYIDSAIVDQGGILLIVVVTIWLRQRMLFPLFLVKSFYVVLPLFSFVPFFFNSTLWYSHRRQNKVSDFPFAGFWLFGRVRWIATVLIFVDTPSRWLLLFICVPYVLYFTSLSAGVMKVFLIVILYRVS